MIFGRIEIALLLIAGLIIIFLLTNHYASSKRQRPFPPGPRPLFLAKNIHQLPQSYPWRAFQEWHKTYGPIICLRYGQQVMVSIGSYDVAHDLLEKRKDIYDSRPRWIFAAEHICKGLHTVALPYGALWKTHRRLASNFLSNRQVRSYQYLQDVESKQLLYDLLGSKDFSGEFRRFNLSVIMTLAYGKRLESKMSREVKEFAQLEHDTAAVFSHPMSGLVDAFPILNRLPRWAAPWKRMGDAIFDSTNKFFQENMRYAQSSTSYNWARRISDLKEAQGLSLIELSYIVGVLVQGGFDTMTSTLEFFTMASVLHPESVGKAQEELDSVVGQNRLPSFDDISNLPYVNSFIKEVLRWRTVAPMAMPHSPLQDDEYRGYHIPKGAMIFPNQWAINLDDESFQDPYEFKPERWLQHPDRPFCTFGFGRRSCLGKQMAQNSLFIVIARILWAYNISHCYVNGKKVSVDSLDTAQTIINGPSPFEASFSIRSPAHQRIVEQGWESITADVNITVDHIYSL
ncbi:cytochrome P450 [Elaphomyces granulatus]